MAQFFTDINLHLNQLKNVVIENVATDPTGKEGQIIFNTTDKVYKGFKDGKWEVFATVAELETAIETLNSSLGSVTYDLAQHIETADATYATKDEVTSAVSDLDDSKADKATTLAGYGISDAYTKTEVDAKMSSVYKYRGTVASEDDLPTTDNVEGDVYNVESTGDNFAWVDEAEIDGEIVPAHWDKLAGIVDLSGIAMEIAGLQTNLAQHIYDAEATFATKDELETEKGNLEDSIDNVSKDLAQHISDAEATFATKDELEYSVAQLEEALETSINESIHQITATNPQLTPVDGKAVWTISHTLDSDVSVTLKEFASNEVVYADVVTESKKTTITINSDSVIAEGTFKAIILGTLAE